MYRPQQRAAADMFHIPPDSMAALRANLRRNRVMVAAQVHWHPREAFHSLADDHWTIVRHELACMGRRTIAGHGEAVVAAERHRLWLS